MIRLMHISQRDTCGWILPYAYLKGGTLYHAEISTAGYWVAYTRFPFKYIMDERRGCDGGAGENKRGSWD
jgi:hypothetical protein